MSSPFCAGCRGNHSGCLGIIQSDNGDRFACECECEPFDDEVEDEIDEAEFKLRRAEYRYERDRKE